jgi:hypothetical protein
MNASGSVKKAEKQKRRPSLRGLKKYLREAGFDEAADSEEYAAGLVLLTPLAISTIDPDKVSSYSGVPLEQVRVVKIID